MSGFDEWWGRLSRKNGFEKGKRINIKAETLEKLARQAYMLDRDPKPPVGMRGWEDLFPWTKKV